MTSAFFDRLTGGRLFFKCENLQKVGAFKFRGACNAVFSLPGDALRRGVATHSSGNHAQALALAARLRSAKAYIVMPRNAPEVKRQAVADYGAQIIPCEPTVADREATAARVVADTGATLIHPYNDPRIIAGQGTAALELLADVPDLDYLLAPVGGGGLVSGTAIAAAGVSPKTRVIAVEPAGADDACRSLRAGHIIPSENPQTIADGLRTSLGELDVRRDSAARARNPHRLRGRHRRRHAARLGADEDRHRAVVGRAPRGAARKAPRRGWQARGHHPQRRQRRCGDPAVSGCLECGH